LGYEVPLSGAMLGVSVHAVWQPQVRNKAVYLVVDDAVHTNNTGVDRIASRHRIKASAFLRRTVSVGRNSCCPRKCPSSVQVRCTVPKVILHLAPWTQSFSVRCVWCIAMSWRETYHRRVSVRGGDPPKFSRRVMGSAKAERKVTADFRLR